MSLDTIVRDFFVSSLSAKQMQISTIIGESVYIMLALVLIFLVYNFVKDKKDFRFTKLAAGAIVLLVLVEVMKMIFPRVRPDDSGLDSFPSRHTALAFFLSYFWPEKKTKIIFYTWAIVIAVSRLASNIHWFTDVLAGVAIGIAFAFVINKINVEKIIKKLKEL